MAIQRTVTCDVTGKTISEEDLPKLTICSVQYKKIGKVPGFNGQPDIECITNVDEYEFHISPEKSNAFMRGLQELLDRLKE